ncbi:DUF4124 domain-containing protein [Franzmannia qiaohouensis]|uniref:DUF4124 domain-containing protein n=1 Tax=Franzmannia qiaohouensis TaxID=1329370 RepID=A0ABU1HJU4_9GAMM|nr:DUF4124 domain-containing protein [Halomonas qiaohouensis]MDR5907542.1 DUF4124 domain-containing protein [Halomonas qiaohouensis]
MRVSPINAACCVLLVALLGAASGAQATSIYRTTDAQGNVVFTDNPERGGEEVELNPLTVVPSGQRAPAPQSRPEASASPSSPSQAVSSPFMPYSTFRIAAPRNEETLQTGEAGNLQVELGIEPALREDHRVRLLVDGAVSQSAMHSDVFMLGNLERGERVLQAELLDASGEVRHRSAPVTLYVQRASVNLPQNPNNPN